MLRTGDRSGSPRGEPCFDFVQIPYDTSRRECEASRELATLFHLIDRAVGERHDFPQLMPPYRALDRCFQTRCHLDLLGCFERIESDRWQKKEELKQNHREVAGLGVGIGWLFIAFAIYRSCRHRNVGCHVCDKLEAGGGRS